MILYDTHAHSDHPELEKEISGIVARAQAAGVQRIITIGTDLESSAHAVRLSDQWPSIFAVVGWHPCSASSAPADIRPALRELARHPRVVAIGETGLDYHHLPSPPSPDDPDHARFKAKQAEVFEQQLEVAAELGLNCVVHQRDAIEDTLRLMAPHAPRVRGQFHCFVNDPATMQRVLAIGSLVSFTGILTFRSATTVRETLAATPMDQFMLETDSPYLAPMPYRGKRCEPAYVAHTATAAAEVKAVSLEELAEATCATAHRFFPKLTAP